MCAAFFFASVETPIDNRANTKIKDLMILMVQSYEKKLIRPKLSPLFYETAPLY